MTVESIFQTLSITKALADGNRLRVIMALATGEEMCACQIIELLGLSPATVSRHMGVLLQGDLVTRRKEGRWVIYRLSPRFPGELLQWLESDLGETPEIRADRIQLDAIFASDREELCRVQRRSPAVTPSVQPHQIS